MDDFCITDRHRLATELIAALSQNELNKLIPPCLKDKSHHEVFDAIREQLECMSKERIRALLKDEEYTSAEESEGDESKEGSAEIDSEEDRDESGEDTVAIDRESGEEEEEEREEREEEEEREERDDEEEVEEEGEEEIELLPLSEGNEQEREEGEVTPDYKFSP
ncbi:hypothetical protein PMAYCL1PPCAC_06160 [Pristionchus mayeri]|uniref:Uncharacterized protein n=1 Tax=Pristionchus mayeri TaxID=1317129 RepID=A0AAN4ZE09_9BILA|nr:hypothetical protein PMAYCL1PPCAC_06160 [Pristionchus mayeri]